MSFLNPVRAKPSKRYGTAHSRKEAHHARSKGLTRLQRHVDGELRRRIKARKRQITTARRDKLGVFREKAAWR